MAPALLCTARIAATSPLAVGALRGPSPASAPHALSRRARRAPRPLPAIGGDEDPRRRRQQQQQQQRPAAVALESEEEDPAPEGIAPSLFLELGVPLDSFMDDSCARAKQDVKARCVGAAIWGSLATVGFFALGGLRGYFADMDALTGGGAIPDNFNFVWAMLACCFAVKSGVLAGVTGVRAFLFAQSPPPAAGKTDGVAWWRWQEARARRESSANWYLIECAVASALAAAATAGAGGTDMAQLRFETLDEGALCRLTVALWLFWESYLAGIKGMGAGGKAAINDEKRRRLTVRRAAQEQRRQERQERMRRVNL